MKWDAGQRPKGRYQIRKKEQAWNKMCIGHVQMKEVGIWLYLLDFRAEFGEIGRPERYVYEKTMRR